MQINYSTNYNYDGMPTDAFVEANKAKLNEILGDGELILVVFDNIDWDKIEEVVLFRDLQYDHKWVDVNLNNNSRLEIGPAFHQFAVWKTEDNLRLVVAGGTRFVVLKQQLPALRSALSKYDLSPKFNDNNLNIVYWNEETNILKKDVMFFVNRYKWFLQRKLPYNRSYLLYGPPGNGKSLAVRAIGKYLCTKPKCFDFSAAYEAPDSAFSNWVLQGGKKAQIKHMMSHIDQLVENRLRDMVEKCAENDEGEPLPVLRCGDIGAMPNIRLLVLEDLDRYFPKDGANKETRVTLAAILNALDGATEKENTVIIATANTPENLDQQVLLRPGRFDRRIKFNVPSADDATKFLRQRFVNDNVSEQAIGQIVEQLQGHSYALLAELYKSAGAASFDSGHEVITDEDLLAASNDHLKFILDPLKQRDKGKFGF